jgi:hypothetical protein
VTAHGASIQGNARLRKPRSSCGRSSWSRRAARMRMCPTPPSEGQALCRRAANGRACVSERRTGTPLNCAWKRGGGKCAVSSTTCADLPALACTRVQLWVPPSLWRRVSYGNDASPKRHPSCHPPIPIRAIGRLKQSLSPAVATQVAIEVFARE